MTARRPPRRDPEPAGRSDGLSAALVRTAALIGERAPVVVREGYLDVLGSAGVPRSGPQLAMQSRLLPKIYEGLWRPIIFGAATIGTSEEGEAVLMRELLQPAPGDLVLDVACGPGNTTRRLTDAIGRGGLAVGVDAAPAMLERAVHDTSAANAAYVRADGAALPFDDGAFDGVACFGALYLVDRPFAVLEELIRVLAPGGRIAILTSCNRAPGPTRRLIDVAARPTGFRWFHPDAITHALAAHGLVEIRREIRGVMQYVGARRPS